MPVFLAKALAWRGTPLLLMGLVIAGLIAALSIERSSHAETRGERDAKAAEIAVLNTTIDKYDLLIARQNDGIRALAAQRGEDREVYIRNYAAADERARNRDARAASILALPNEQIDELAQCRASRLLLEQELVE